MSVLRREQCHVGGKGTHSLLPQLSGSTRRSRTGGGDPVFIVDEDCHSTVRYGVAVNVIGGLRQDDIAVIDREGSMTRLTRDHSSFDPSFSPDGAALAFVAGVGIWEGGCGWGGQAIKVMDIDGSTKRKVTDGRHYDSEPAWSPDGDVIAFVRSRVGLMVVPAT